MTDFNGMPRGVFGFFERLKENNTKAWWAENRRFYDAEIRPSFTALLDALGEIYRPWRIYRPHRDTRFAKDKAPYKNFIGGVTMLPSGNGHFIQIRASGLLIGSGYAMMAKDQLARFRQAVADDTTGPAFYKRLKAAEARGVTITGGRYDRLVSAPKGYARDHPRIHWLRAKGVEVSTRLGRPEWIYSADAVGHIRKVLVSGADVTDWLDTHVGPSVLSPEEIWGGGRSRR